MDVILCQFETAWILQQYDKPGIRRWNDVAVFAPLLNVSVTRTMQPKPTKKE